MPTSAGSTPTAAVSAPGSCSRGASRGSSAPTPTCPKARRCRGRPSRRDPKAWLDPLVAWAKRDGAFALRLGFPIVSRVWDREPVKKQVAEGGLLSFTTLPSAVDNPVARSMEAWLDANQWLSIGGDGVAVGQPRLLCIVDLRGRAVPELLRSMNQQWRRNVKKAEKSGVEVRTALAEGLDTFYDLYVESAERDNFLPRPKAYFDLMARSFMTESADSPVQARFYEAHVDGDVLASALMIRFGRTFSYLYGGSTERNRDARASNALQWKAMQDAALAGCEAYDFRGFNTSLGATSPADRAAALQARRRGRRRRDGGGARARHQPLLALRVREGDGGPDRDQQAPQGFSRRRGRGRHLIPSAGSVTRPG